MSQPRPAIRDYPDAVDWLMSFADFERGSGPRRARPDFALDRIRSLLRRLDDPQHGPRTVHIAGSKGKGSTAAMIESILRAAGLRTGLFTSPHLHSFAERIRIDGQPIPDDQFARLCEQLRPAVDDELAADPGHISTFELLTALAFLAFRQHQIDVQIVEVGLGGRLDCTNVFARKDAAVITSLSHEHTDILGDQITQIAAEKAGIITAGAAAAVLAPQREPAAADVVRNAADDVPTPLIDVARDYAWTPQGVEPWGQWFRLQRRHPRPGEAPDALFLIPLLGDFQIENAAAAVAAADLLAANGLPIDRAALHTGLAAVHWPARLEALAWPDADSTPRPRIVVDGAHNAESLQRALDALERYFPHQRLFVVFGLLGDKALDGMAEIIRGRAHAVLATASQHPRARPAEEIAAAFAGWERDVYVAADPADAVVAAAELASPQDLIAVLGSLSLAADVRSHLQAQAADNANLSAPAG